MSDGGEKGMDRNFELILRRLAGQNRIMQAALHNEDRRRWEVFNYDVGEDGSVEYDEGSGMGDPDAVHSLFGRSDAEKIYVEAHTKSEPGADHVGMVMAAKAQVDFLAGIERDFNARHMSRIRLMAHEAARRRAFAHDKGPLLDDAMTWIKLLKFEGKR